MSEPTDLDALAVEVSELMWRVHEAQKQMRQIERDDDARALRNFMALAPFARPESLPPLRRWGRRPQRDVPRGVPVRRRGHQ